MSSTQPQQQQLLQTARSLWLTARSENDLQRAAELYRRVWRGDSQHTVVVNANHKRRRVAAKDDHGNDNGNGCCDDDASLRRQAGEKLALLLLQQSPTNASGSSNRDDSNNSTKEADAMLQELGYTCRLASHVLHYETALTMGHNNNNHKTANIPCRAWNDFLTADELRVLQSVFGDPTAAYWRQHQYSVEPQPSPYVSYAIPLPQPNEENGEGDGESGDGSNDSSEEEEDDSNQQQQRLLQQEYGFLGHLIHKILQQLTGQNDDNQKEWNNTLLRPHQVISHVELWAHNRPHATGHQLHFDSDNEGQPSSCNSSPKHPLVSTILYLSGENDKDENENDDTPQTNAPSRRRHVPLGGPSLITNQRLVSRHLATKGWLCFPKLQRMTAFDGRVLHGVIPGQGCGGGGGGENVDTNNGSGSGETNHHDATEDPATRENTTNLENTPQFTGGRRRVTLMLAFWRRLQVREYDPDVVVGAARPFPKNDTTAPDWVKTLTQPWPPSTAATNGAQNDKEMTTKPKQPQPVAPIALPHVYETVVGPPNDDASATTTANVSSSGTQQPANDNTTKRTVPWTPRMGMPTYDQIFQGF